MEPIPVMMADNSNTMAEHTIKHKVIGKEGWKRLLVKKYAKRERRRRLSRMIQLNKAQQVAAHNKGAATKLKAPFS